MCVFLTKFWRQKLQSYNVSREKLRYFCMKKAHVKHWWNRPQIFVNVIPKKRTRKNRCLNSLRFKFSLLFCFLDENCHRKDQPNFSFPFVKKEIRETEYDSFFVWVNLLCRTCNLRKNKIEDSNINWAKEKY